MGKIVYCLILGLGLLFIIPAILMWLWNGILVDLFNFPVIGYWQSVGLYMISNILFGSTSVRSSFDD